MARSELVYVAGYDCAIMQHRKTDLCSTVLTLYVWPRSVFHSNTSNYDLVIDYGSFLD